MAKRPYVYQDLSWPELRDLAATDPVVVLPVGTTEQHGPHLPLSTDYLTAGTIAHAAVAELYPHALVMEAVPYSFNEHHMDFPGTITIDVHTIIDYIAAIGTSVAHHGFRHLVLFNGHGSNVPFLDVAARMITNRSEAVCALASWWSLLKPEDLAWRESPFPGGFSHGCEAETSLLLGIAPDLVDMTRAVRTMDEVQTSEHIWWDLAGSSGVFFQEFFSRNTATGVQGDATLATEEKGRLLFAAATRRLSAFLEEFRRREIRPRRDLHGRPPG
ncbi:MAG TPA: creatininase family protein [Chloroflexota bacterium]|nr:creatininase family protein [Chloroflexota bacterium]